MAVSFSVRIATIYALLVRKIFAQKFGRINFLPNLKSVINLMEVYAQFFSVFGLLYLYIPVFLFPYLYFITWCDQPDALGISVFVFLHLYESGCAVLFVLYPEGYLSLFSLSSGDFHYPHTFTSYTNVDISFSTHSADDKMDENDDYEDYDEVPCPFNFDSNITNHK